MYAGDGDVAWAFVPVGGTMTRMLSLPGGVSVDIPAAGALTWSYPSLQGHTITTGNGTATIGVRLYDPFGQPLKAGSLALGTADADDSGSVNETMAWHEAAQKLLLVAGIVTLFTCPVCAAVVAVASVGMGIYKSATGCPEEGVWDILGGATFGVGAAATRLGAAAVRFASISNKFESAGVRVNARWGATFQRRGAARIVAGTDAIGIGLTGKSAIDVGNRIAGMGSKPRGGGNVVWRVM